MRTMKGSDLLAKLSSAIASLMFIWAMFRQFVPDQLRLFVERHTQRLLYAFSPYVVITFSEYSTNSLFKRSKAFSLVETYLGSKTVTGQAKRLRADFVKNNQSRLVMTLDDHEEVTDVFNGVKVWWSSKKQHTSGTQTISFYPSSSNSDKRLLTLTFHGKYRDVVTKSYIEHVMEEAKSIQSRNRQRKLFTNGAGGSWSGWERSGWNHVVFEHPASFETLAMDPNKKQEIINDLVTFTKAKDYYARIGKTWKRGYLLYGPPGTGKSTMIAAMANLLCYDVYDLELTAVRNNTELRKLLIDTTSKAIVVIEDIDCSLDLTGQRKKKKEVKSTGADDPLKDEKERSEEGSKVTLSGLLNIIDGLWSACEGERIIVFTTNFVDKLDPALTRRGRMDKHIEMSYCRFEGFRVLVKNYWGVDEHHLFDTIKILLDETDMSPADVSENLMPKCPEDDVDTCLASLVEALRESKEAAESKSKKEASDLKSNKEEEIGKDEASDLKTKEVSDLKSNKEEEIGKDEASDLKTKDVSDLKSNKEESKEVSESKSKEVSDLKSDEEASKEAPESDKGVSKEGLD